MAYDVRKLLIFRINVLSTSVHRKEGGINFPFTLEELEAMTDDDLIELVDALVELSRIPPKRQ